MVNVYLPRLRQNLQKKKPHSQVKYVKLFSRIILQNVSREMLLPDDLLPI